MATWYDDPEFWRLGAPTMFGPAQVARARDDVAALQDRFAERGVTLSQARILDLPSGPGRHTLPLLALGAQVTASDLMPDHLDAIRAQTDTDRLTTLVGDMRHVALPTDHFDVALNLYTSLGYFEAQDDDLRVLRRVHDALRPGGWLVVDTMGVEVLARLFQPTRFFEVAPYVVEEHATLTESWERIEVTRHLRHDREVHTVSFTHWLYSSGTLKRALRAAGFSGAIEVYGSLAGAPYDHEAQRLVVFAQRAEVA